MSTAGGFGLGRGECTVNRFLIALASLVLVIAACGPQTGGGTTATPAASPTRGGTLIFAMWQEPSTLAGPYLNQTIAGLVAQTIAEGLAETDNDGNYYGKLAKDIPTVQNGGVKLSADGKKMDVTWELKPGIKWSDGQ